MPILEIEAGEGYLYSARWSPIRPMVFAVTTESGKVLVYDLKKNKTTPSMAIEANDRGVPIFSMQFNQARYFFYFYTSVYEVQRIKREDRAVS